MMCDVEANTREFSEGTVYCDGVLQDSKIHNIQWRSPQFFPLLENMTLTVTHILLTSS